MPLYTSVVQGLESVGASIYGPYYEFVMNADLAMELLPASLHTSFHQFAKCLFEKRCDLEYVRKLKDMTFRGKDGGYFHKKMTAGGVYPVEIDIFMIRVKRMFDCVAK